MPGHGLVNDCDRHRLVIVVLTKRPAVDRWLPHGFKIICAHNSDVHARGQITLRYRTALDLELYITGTLSNTAATEREVGRHGSRLDTSDRPNAVQHLAIEILELLRLGVTGRIGGDP